MRPEVAALGVEHEGVDPLEAAVAATVGETGVHGEWLREHAAGLGGCLRRQLLGELDRRGRLRPRLGDPEISPLAPQSPGVGLAADVMLQAVDAIQADRVLFARGGADPKAVAVGPVGRHQPAALDGREFLRPRRSASEQREHHCQSARYPSHCRMSPLPIAPQ